MTDFRLLNGGTKCTVIETFDGRAVLLYGGERKEFPCLEECKKHIVEEKLEVNIEFLFGSPTKRELQKRG
jgi:hypothetical protein